MSDLATSIGEDGAEEIRKLFDTHYCGEVDKETAMKYAAQIILYGEIVPEVE